MDRRLSTGPSNEEAQKLLHGADTEDEIPEVEMVTCTIYFSGGFSCKAYLMEPGRKFHRFEINEDTIGMQGLMIEHLVIEHNLSEQLAQGIVTSWIADYHDKKEETR